MWCISYPTGISATAASLVKNSSKVSQSSSDLCHYASAKAEASLLGSGESSYAIMMKKKLKSHPNFKGRGENELMDTANKLISEEELYSYFNHLIEGLQDALAEMARFDNSSLTHSLEREKEKQAQQIRFDRLTDLKLEIFVRNTEKGDFSRFSITTPLATMFCMDYGDKHAAILVGDVILEWGRTNVIIPRRVTDDDISLFPFKGEIMKSGECFHQIAKRRPQLTDPLETYDEEKENLTLACAKKNEIIMKIIEVIVKYNSTLYYNLAERNCQNFVKDVQKSIGIEHATFTPEDQEYLELFMRVPKSFKSHEDIDSYIMKIETRNELSKLGLQGLQHLMKAYNQHHGKKHNCTYPTCQFPKLTTAFSLKQQEA